MSFIILRIFSGLRAKLQESQELFPDLACIVAGGIFSADNLDPAHIFLSDCQASHETLPAPARDAHLIFSLIKFYLARYVHITIQLCHQDTLLTVIFRT